MANSACVQVESIWMLEAPHVLLVPRCIQNVLLALMQILVLHALQIILPLVNNAV